MMKDEQKMIKDENKQGLPFRDKIFYLMLANFVYGFINKNIIELPIVISLLWSFGTFVLLIYFAVKGFKQWRANKKK